MSSVHTCHETEDSFSFCPLFLDEIRMVVLGLPPTPQLIKYVNRIKTRILAAILKYSKTFLVSSGKMTFLGVRNIFFASLMPLTKSAALINLFDGLWPYTYLAAPKWLKKWIVQRPFHAERQVSTIFAIMLINKPLIYKNWPSPHKQKCVLCSSPRYESVLGLYGPFHCPRFHTMVPL